jgi:hypothetical protein
VALPEKKRSWLGTRELSYAFGGLLAIACGVGIVARMPSRIVEKREIEVKNTTPDLPPTHSAPKPKAPKTAGPAAARNGGPVEQADPKAAPGRDPEAEKVEIEVQTNDDPPAWVEKLKKAPDVNLRTEPWKPKKYKPHKRDVRLFYFPSAEKQKDRILKLIPASVKVQVEADPKMTYGTDIVIVLPTEPEETADACDASIDESGEKSCADRTEFTASVDGGRYGAKL